MKSRLQVILLMLSFLVLIIGAAQSGTPSIEVTSNAVEMQLPEGINFRLEAVSLTQLAHLTLIYSTNSRTCQSSVARHTFRIEPDFSIEQDWLWRFQRSGIVPPGAELWWQWELQDDQGYSQLTDRQEVVVTDPRYTWQQYNRENLTLQWYAGEPAFGRQLHDIARQSLARLEQDYGIDAPQDIWITVYPSFEEVQAITVHSPEWTGGVAYPEYNNIIIGIPPGEQTWAQEVIPHELSHLVVGILTFNCRGVRPPTWLEEGLAVNAEGPLEENARAEVLAALESDSLPSLRSLTQGFSAFAESAGRSYTQSGMVIAYLVATYGPDRLGELLATLQAGNKVDESLELVYGFDTTGLDIAWRQSLGFEASLPASTSATGPSPTATVIPTLALWTFPVKSSATPQPTEKPMPSATTGLQDSPVPSPTNLLTPPSSELTNPPPRFSIWIAVGVCLLGVAGGVGWLVYTRRSR